MPAYYDADDQIFVHAGVDEEAGEYWMWGTSDDLLFGKFPASKGKFYKTIVAGHVGISVARGVENGVNGDCLCAEVYHSQLDGDAGLVGDVQKAGVPAVGAAAGTLGGDGNMQAVGVAKLFDDGLCQRLAALLTLHRYASDGLENPAQGRKEPRRLHHKAGMTGHGGVGEFAQDKVSEKRNF